MVVANSPVNSHPVMQTSSIAWRGFFVRETMQSRHRDVENEVYMTSPSDALSTTRSDDKLLAPFYSI
jgi:hypothetical protein